MTTLLRGLLAGLLVIGLTAVGSAPGEARAQAKKDPAKDPPKTPVAKKPEDKGAADDLRNKSVGFGTSDGLSLNGYWFKGVGVEKQRPDAVMMFPAPGNKVNDAWIGLASELSKKNFSVLLFDWRGLGMNAADTAGSRIFEDKGKFWNEQYNKQLLLKSRAQIEDKGLDYRTLVVRSDGALRYRDFMLNDLLAARFYLDRKNDDKDCNTNRVWIVTEKDGGQLALALISFEFLRNSINDPKNDVTAFGKQWKPAGKDYVGLTVLSPGPGSGQNTATASAVIRNAFSTMPAQGQREARDHMEHRLAMVLVYGKKEGQSGSKALLSQVGAGGSEDQLKTNFKYVRELDNSKAAKAVTGIDLIDPMDSFGAKAEVVRSMVEISKDKQNFGKDSIDREANKMTVVPRFPAERMGSR
jgi:hypothetical protein